MKKLQAMIYQGLLKKGYKNDNITLVLNDDPLADLISDYVSLCGNVLKVYYLVTDKFIKNIDDIKMWDRIKAGKIEAEYFYGETPMCNNVTVEEFKIAGEDYIEELEKFIGKYLVIKIEEFFYD